MGIHSERDLADFLIIYTRDMAVSDEEPGAILDRYFVPDFEYCNDGLVIDRQRMIDHVRPVRRNVDKEAMAADDWSGVEIHEALVSGDRIAARWTLRTTLRKGKTFAAEIYMFGRLALDGRILRIDQVSRQLEEAR
ncbi:nuclear transport factor 2 family protein [Nonomuraea phyllanthi]|uniref:Nuclear transport factor 2 family protein n=1 Tax=Nonomuraea phyllanthi TaxID=2219224 RepID=A0A5C4VHA7_9ACTN|nr:nuclear transport factor 2 family protein [Nonomuraea phyllanthi]KAB8189009.1 nuclear transport factor 2 family protein [Nonomuraea phyllanthi]QFY09685.1 nuclear transport factor 2 family protein [Nonomuraea phyllanthi]